MRHLQPDPPIIAPAHPSLHTALFANPRNEAADPLLCFWPEAAVLLQPFDQSAIASRKDAKAMLLDPQEGHCFADFGEEVLFHASHHTRHSVQVNTRDNVRAISAGLC